MKPFKILQVAALCLTMSLGSMIGAKAQQKMSPEQRVQIRVQRMKKQLALTDDQVAKIKPVLMDAQQKMMQLRNSGGDAQAMKQQRKDIATDTDNKITALLNPAQIQKYNTMKAQMKDRRMQNNGGAVHGQPGE